MKSRATNKQLFALPAPPPESVTIAGLNYKLSLVFKHDFFAATCLYELVETMPPVQNRQKTVLPKLVVKFGRSQSFCGLPLSWLGEFTRDHEEAVYTQLAGVTGVPRWAGRVGKFGYAIEYIEGSQLDKTSPLPGFFDQLRIIFDAIHARGVAYVDANKRSNILITPDGRPYVIDYQISIRRRDDLPWPISAISKSICDYFFRKDLYHLYKHKRRIAPQELTQQEEELSRWRSPLHQIHRKLTKPYRNLRRSFLRKKFEDGSLVSPTANMESHDMPEKETWREK